MGFQATQNDNLETEDMPPLSEVDITSSASRQSSIFSVAAFAIKINGNPSDPSAIAVMSEDQIKVLQERRRSSMRSLKNFFVHVSPSSTNQNHIPEVPERSSSISSISDVSDTSQTNNSKSAFLSIDALFEGLLPSRGGHSSSKQVHFVSEYVCCLLFFLLEKTNPFIKSKQIN